MNECVRFPNAPKLFLQCARVNACAEYQPFPLVDNYIYSTTRSQSLSTLFYENVVFPAQAEYSYFSADFRYS